MRRYENISSSVDQGAKGNLTMVAVSGASRTCPECGLSKELHDFDVRTDTGRRRSTCKDCRRSYQRRHYASSRPPTARTARRVLSAELLPCTRCLALKAGSEFPPRGPKSRRVHSWCRACFSQYNAERYIALRSRELVRLRRNRRRTVEGNRRRVAAYLSEHPCVDCSQTDPVVLEFDHLREKRMDVSRMVHLGWRWPAILNEIEKCEVRCANCHRRRTKERCLAARAVPIDRESG